MTLELRANPETGRIRWTRRAVRALAESGLIDLEAFELLDGELIQKVKNRVLAYLRLAFGDAFVQHEMPILLSDVPDDTDTSLPEPDAAVLFSATDDFTDAPSPGAIRLLIEVSDSTLGKDLGAKATLYASIGIVEYWVIDIPGQRLHVHRGPGGDIWREVRIYSAVESVAPLAAPTQPVPVADLLPPAP
jgi:Uma2 family endonuclease